MNELAYLLHATPAEIRAIEERDLATLIAVVEEASRGK